jgi:hypothetical protein
VLKLKDKQTTFENKVLKLKDKQTLENKVLKVKQPERQMIVRPTIH